VTVLLCLGLVMPAGPIGPWKSVMGAEVDGFLSRGERSDGALATAAAMMWGCMFWIKQSMPSVLGNEVFVEPRNVSRQSVRQ